MIPVATETIVSNCSVVITYPPIWASIIPTLLGGILAATAGLAVAERQRRVEKKERRRLIASGLLQDFKRAKRIFGNIPSNSPRELLDTLAVVSSIPTFKQGLFYPLNGFYSAHYADLINLDKDLAKEIYDIYIDLDVLDSFCLLIPQRDVNELAKKAELKEMFQNFVKLKADIDRIIPALDAVVNE